MATAKNDIEIFNTQGEIFPSTSADNVKTTDFNFFFPGNEIFPYLLQPSIIAAQAPEPESPISPACPVLKGFTKTVVFNMVKRCVIKRS
ncbi:MAG: hypothetical protein AABY22_08620 [Nanoarchaeota archaeon]